MKSLWIFLILIIPLNNYAQKGEESNEGKVVNNKVHYQPISPLPVFVINRDTSKGINNKSILEELPDENTRFGVREQSQDLNANYSSFIKTDSKKESYEVIFDWIKYNSTIALKINNGKASLLMPYEDYLEILEDGQINISSKQEAINDSQGNLIKLIIGVGVRVKAEVYTQKRGVSFADIIGIGASASENKVRGNLEIQSLGITGESITSLIPLPTELNKGSIQNLLTNIAAIREKIYTLERNEEDFLKVQITPRVVGYENLSNVEYTESQILSFIYQAIPYLVVNIPDNANSINPG